MRSQRISKRGLASPGSTIMVEVVLPPPLIVRTSYGRGRAVAGDGYYDSDLSTQVIAATVIEGPWSLAIVIQGLGSLETVIQGLWSLATVIQGLGSLATVIQGLGSLVIVIQDLWSLVTVIRASLIQGPWMLRQDMGNMVYGYN
ncbi:hypothetical protein AVEN_8902-1 [Araneus ventricosus]|uniref:Uncharacterized protein n=1 Tax=Araneus ventricosus TaxID=182803 RepID=A0A4Y2DFH1_ARAVE|nr:hypothetical protein AVEN_8902-1 [Araneus ventricosus]